MKKTLILMFMLAFLFVLSANADTVAIYPREKAISYPGWSIHGADDDIDTAGGLITELDTTYAQLAAEDTLEIVSAAAGDITQTITISGIDNSGNRIVESIALDTADGTTVVGSTNTFRYVDQVETDIECAGAITVRRATGDTFITSIPIGQLQATMVQHFNGEKHSFITGWEANVTSTTGTVLFQLRWYPDDADCLDAADGFRVLDEIQFNNVHDNQYRPFSQPIKCPAGGWIAVWGTGGSDNADGSVTVQGIDW